MELEESDNESEQSDAELEQLDPESENTGIEQEDSIVEPELDDDEKPEDDEMPEDDVETDCDFSESEHEHETNCHETRHRNSPRASENTDVTNDIVVTENNGQSEASVSKQIIRTDVCGPDGRTITVYYENPCGSDIPTVNQEIRTVSDGSPGQETIVTICNIENNASMPKFW